MRAVFPSVISFALTASAVVICFAVVSASATTPIDREPSPLRLATLPAPPPPSNKTHPNGNLTISVAEPSFTAVAGDYMGMQFELRVAHWIPADGSFNVTVPGSKATFYYGTNSSFSLFEGRQNITISGASSSNPTLTQVDLQLSSDTSFDRSKDAVFSTNLLALMTPFPTGTFNISARWQWYVLTSGGTFTFGNWSASVNTTPVQDAWLGQNTGGQVTLNSNYTACLTGPVQGRNISLHIEEVNPLDDFSNTTQTVPVNWSGPFCLRIPIGAALPNNLTVPQPLLVHLWDYGHSFIHKSNQTYLLYVINVRCVNVTRAPPSSWDALLLKVSWQEWALIGGAAVAVAVVVTRLRSRRGGRTTSPPPVPPSTPPAGAMSSPLEPPPISPKVA